MELKDTIKLMWSADYKDRFKAEYYQLKIRKEKLSNMLNKYDEVDTLGFNPKCSYKLLSYQLECMNEYLEVLEERAKIEDIKL